MKKTYIKPTLEVAYLKVERMLNNSANSVSGLDGVTMSKDEFGGGAADGKIRGSRSTDSFDDLW